MKIVMRSEIMIWIVIWHMPYTEPLHKIYEDEIQARTRYQELIDSPFCEHVYLGTVNIIETGK